MIKYARSRQLKSVDWRQAAACRDEDPETFFPVGTSGPAEAQTEQAREICRECPAIGYCALFAMETGQDGGVWGGMSEEERRALNRGKINVLVFAQELQNRFVNGHPDSVHLPDLIEPIPMEPTKSAPAIASPQYFRA